MMIKHFSISTPTTTAAVKSDDQRLHCTTRNGTKFALLARMPDFCRMLSHGAWILGRRLSSGCNAVSYTIHLRRHEATSGERPGRNKWPLRPIHRKGKKAFRYSRPSMLKWPGALSCIKGNIGHTPSGTSCNNSVSYCSKVLQWTYPVMRARSM
jgi:hypothetical protein